MTIDSSLIDKSIKILVVDDQLMIRDMLNAILRSNGFNNIIFADDGATALARLETEEEPVGLIICDWNMPKLTGINLLKRLRAVPATANTPFIMLTAEAYRENVTDALEAGVSNYISKPFTSETLLKKVMATLKRNK